ncbi:MAG TPA: hypothetical protein VFJ77_07195 [Gaiellaceae bacterium]|nr:hypothetical protein [Gaiellaceae bacterium]
MQEAQRARRPWVVAVGAAVVALVLAATATAALHASKHRSGTRAQPAAKLAKTSLGRVLVDARGRTLYMFTHDRRGRSACYGACAAAWPPLLVKAKPKALPGLKARLIGTTKRKDGRLQLSYARHPLYLFAFDRKAGAVTGQAVKEFGGTWWVLRATGKPVTKAATSGSGSTTPPPTTTAPSDSGGDAWG